MSSATAIVKGRVQQLGRTLHDERQELNDHIKVEGDHKRVSSSAVLQISMRLIAVVLNHHDKRRLELPTPPIPSGGHGHHHLPAWIHCEWERCNSLMKHQTAQSNICSKAKLTQLVLAVHPRLQLVSSL